MPANLLIHEKSPYLLQHAHNPVDWHPWGEEAFAKARQEDKPIFLSIGYSTCHWCHVMERESFENEETAALLNRHFVPIKVDREERPDIDRIYMLYVQATTGSGGWPMSVWLTPELRPFLGGTYFPPEPRYGHPGFGEVLERIAEAWRIDRASIVQSSRDAIDHLRNLGDTPARVHGPNGSQPGVSPDSLDESVLDSGFYSFRRSFDSKHGGFGGAPKFPRPSVHNFLLRYYARTGNAEALDLVFATLNQMARGGIHDHLGGGFHRYAVDERWFVPHFEKMLYDQAQLASSCLDGYQISRDEFYADAARRTLDYVLRDMTYPEGGFYSAEDADSILDPARPEVKGEGAYYVWTKAEIDRVLGQPASDWFCYQYGVEEGGNVRDDPHREFTNRNILYAAHLEDETARHFGKPVEEMRAALAGARSKLLKARYGRVRPHLDDKILTAWNGLMISAFAKGAQALEDERYLEAARRAAEFVLAHMRGAGGGKLLRRFREGDAAIEGFLDDYAFFAQGLLDLYEAGFEIRHLETAIHLTESMIAQFEDPEAGGFFATAAGEANLVMRLKDDYDGAEPSGNSIAILNLFRIAQITGGRAWLGIAERALAAFASRLAAAPAGLPQMLAALEHSRAASKPQIVLVGARQASAAFLHELSRRYLPNKAVLLVDGDESRRKLSRWAPEIEGMTEIGGAAAAYVCENFACQLPTSDPREFAKLLEARPGLTAHGR
jgi:uncharacterized protein YyaL (SSP411 family)